MMIDSEAKLLLGDQVFELPRQPSAIFPEVPAAVDLSPVFHVGGERLPPMTISTVRCAPVLSFVEYDDWGGDLDPELMARVAKQMDRELEGRMVRAISGADLVQRVKVQPSIDAAALSAYRTREPSLMDRLLAATSMAQPPDSLLWSFYP